MRYKKSIQRMGPVIALGLVTFLSACIQEKMPILNPNGHVGELEKDLMIATLIIMAVIVIPVMLLTFWMAWRYRAGSGATYDPDFHDSKLIEGITLFVPLITIVVLGWATWSYTHSLDPYRPLGGTKKPYEINAVSLDHKWLFIYPEEGVATVNQLAAPVGHPVTIRLTSDPMMTSIFVPGLLSQIYAMPGMESRANFLAERAEVMDGTNAMFSGPGYSRQRFKTHLLEPDQFAAWVENVRSGQLPPDAADAKAEPILDMARYQELVKRTESEPIMYFASAEGNMFEKIVQIYSPNYKANPLPTEMEFRTGQMGGH